jgi:hypothetical protein
MPNIARARSVPMARAQAKACTRVSTLAPRPVVALDRLLVALARQDQQAVQAQLVAGLAVPAMLEVNLWH